MIHLERFNFFKKKEVEKLYKFISVYDALIYEDTHKIDKLYDSEVSKIKNSVKNKFSIIKTEFEVDNNSISFFSRDSSYLISKYDDDWYIITEHDMDKNVVNYLCDSFEGLLQCIKNEIKIL